MTYAVLQFGIFVVCFAASFYCLSGMRFEMLWKRPDRQKAVVLLFLLSLTLAYLACQAILVLTVFNGF